MDVAFLMARDCAAKSAITRRANSGPGCTAARSRIQDSRGLIQVMRSGAMPWRSSHEQVSMDVLPAPTTT
jgi:hypothetical protein